MNKINMEKTAKITCIPLGKIKEVCGPSPEIFSSRRKLDEAKTIRGINLLLQYHPNIHDEAMRKLKITNCRKILDKCEKIRDEGKIIKGLIDASRIAPDDSDIKGEIIRKLVEILS